MINSRTFPAIKRYFTVCTCCGNEGPEAESETQASQDAQKAGWTTDTIYPSGEMVKRFYCTDCNADKNL